MSKKPVKAVKTVTITVDGETLQVPEGISVAAAVLGHSHDKHTCKNSVTQEPRAPYCMMGVCFECMMEIDGRPNQQSCVTTVKEGMSVRREPAEAEAK